MDSSTAASYSSRSHVGAAVQQESHDVQVAARDGDVQRCPSGFVRCCEIRGGAARAPSQKHPHSTDVRGLQVAERAPSREHHGVEDLFGSRGGTRTRKVY